MDRTTVIAMLVAFFLLGCYPGNSLLRAAFHKKVRMLWRHADELKIAEEQDGNSTDPIA